MLTIGGIATVLSGSATAATPEPAPAPVGERVKCVDCLGSGCHVVFGPGALSWYTDGTSCTCDGDCG